MNGFPEHGKEFGSPVIMIAGVIRFQDIMKIAKPPDTTKREGFGSKGITDLINEIVPSGAGFKPRPSLLQNSKDASPFICSSHIILPRLIFVFPYPLGFGMLIQTR